MAGPLDAAIVQEADCARMSMRCPVGSGVSDFDGLEAARKAGTYSLGYSRKGT